MNFVFFVCALIICCGISQTLAGNVGDTCKVARTGAGGTCRIIQQCQVVINEIVKLGLFPAPCGFQGSNQIICCPNPPTPAPEIRPVSNRISALSKCRIKTNTIFIFFKGEFPKANCCCNCTRK